MKVLPLLGVLVVLALLSGCGETVVDNTKTADTIQAELESTLYVLSAEQFETIKRENPMLGQKLLTYFIAVMAERLTFANRMIGVLRR